MRIKICGVTTVADARLAAQLGADAIGLNFYSGSPRCVTLGIAEEIIDELPPFVEPVAVLVHPSPVDLFFYSDQLGLRTLQCHELDIEGIGEDPDLAPRKLIIAAGIATPEDVAGVRQLVTSCLDFGLSPAGVLLDAKAPGQHGGTGRTLPWHLLEGVSFGVPVILAGGLNPDNVAEAIRIVRPYAVDVASGVESAPGIKDAERIRGFIGNAREAAARV